MLTHAVYSVRCKMCQVRYVGEILRAVSVCCKEHQEAIQLSDMTKSALAEHVHCQEEMHEINWENKQITCTL